MSSSNKKDAVSFFEDYEKISDLIMWFTKDVTLKFNVTLANKDKSGNRMHFHREWQYDSKYLNKSKVISIKRNYGFYLSIDVNKDLENSIMIRQCDMIMLRLKLKKIAKWFSELFKYKDDKIIISGEYESIIMYIGEYKTIQFDPVVLSNDIKTEFKEGIRITLNNNYYFDIDIDTFFEFYYVISSFNMYESAATLVNYLPAEFGKFTKTSEFTNNKNFFDSHR